MNSYLLTFNQDTASRDEVVECIDSIPAVANWMFFFDNTACLVSEASPQEIRDRIRESLPTIQFLVVQMEHDHRSGWLRKAVWDFMRDPKPVLS